MIREWIIPLIYALESTTHILFMLCYSKFQSQHKIGATCHLPHHMVNWEREDAPFLEGGGVAVFTWEINWNLKYLKTKKVYKQKCFSLS